MCGLAGLWTRGAAACDRSLLVASVDHLRHRGPDGEGVYIHEDFGVCHTRLAILDTSQSAAQPMADERFVLAYNGEIYNFRELRSELETQGVSIRSSGDTEVLFQLLARLGAASALPRLRGMFAFAWFDRKTRQLTLARDRWGIKPLFVRWASDILYFASEIRALGALAPVQVDLGRALFATCGLGEKSPRSTLYAGVEHLPPGTYLEVTDHASQLRSYHDVVDLVDEQLYRELDRLPRKALVERGSAILDDAVAEMLVSDAPVGAFVSGGLDSSLIASSAGPLVERLQLFSADVRGPFSERPHAETLARHLGQPICFANFDENDLLRDWVRTTWELETPLITHVNSGPFRRTAALARNQQHKVVLTGEGADELFLGYPRISFARYRPLLAPLEQFNALLRLGRGSASPADHLEVLVQDYARQRRRQLGLERLAHIPANLRAESCLALEMLSEGLLALLWRNDRMGMANSIEARFPFLDERLVKFAVNLPSRWKIGRTLRFHNWKHPFLEDKHLLREIGRRRLPPSLANRRKDGFPTFGLQRIRVSSGFFSGGFVAHLAGLSTAGVAYLAQQADSYFVGKLASLEIWGRLFADRQSIAAVEDHVSRFAAIMVPHSEGSRTHSP